MAANQARPEPRLIQLEGFGQSRQHGAADKVAQLLRRALAGYHRTNQREHGATCRRLPRLDEEAHESRSQGIQSRFEQPGDGGGRIERELDGGDENALLRFEVMEDEFRVNLRGSRDPADRGALVADLGEMRAGGRQDSFPRATCAGPPAGPRHLPSGYRAAARATRCLARRVSISPSTIRIRPAASQALRTATDVPMPALLK